MNKIKDLLYDINDILIAVIIVFAATLIIFTRFDILLAYPESLASAQPPQGGYIHTERPGPSSGPDEPDAGPDDTDSPDGPDSPGEDEPAGQELAEDDPAEDGEQTPPGNIVHSAFSLYIAPGESMTEVGKNLVKLGFFENAQEFLDALEKSNLATRVQAGTFTIPASSTKDEVIKIITKSR